MTGFIKQNDTTKNILNQDKFNAIIYEYIDLMENTDYVIYFKNTLIYDVYSKFFIGMLKCFMKMKLEE